MVDVPDDGSQTLNQKRKQMIGLAGYELIVRVYTQFMFLYWCQHKLTSQEGYIKNKP